MNKNFSSDTRGFNLTELLVVIAIVSTLAVMSFPSIAALSKSGNTNRAITGVAGVLELARQSAIAQNTYTWVVLAARVDNSGTNNIYAVILCSKDGTNTSDGHTLIDLDAVGTYEVGSATSNLIALSKVDSFKGARLGPLSDSPGPTDLTPNRPNENVNFKLPISPSEAISFLNQNLSLQRVIEFTPRGQALVSGAIGQRVELGLQSATGKSVDAHNVAAIQVDGVTGQTRVYRR